MKIQIGKYLIAVKLFVKKLSGRNVVGYTNRTKDGLYIVMLDYDNFRLDWVVEEVKRLQEDFDLGTFYIFKSSENSYHAVCLDKVRFYEYVQILKNSSVDVNYMNVPLHFGKRVWVLRVSNKKDGCIQFVRTVVNPIPALSRKRTQSNAHAVLLHKLFKIPVIVDSPDTQHEVMLARYPI